MSTSTPTRRDLLTGRMSNSAPAHISSAVILARPSAVEAVVAHLIEQFGVEIHARDGSKIVVVMEGRSAGELGEKLARIALAEGVLAANMVYEQLDAGSDEI